MTNESFVIGGDQSLDYVNTSDQNPAVVQYSKDRSAETYDPVTDTITINPDNENAEAQFALGQTLRGVFNEVLGEPTDAQREAARTLAQGYEKSGEMDTDDKHYNLVTGDFAEGNKVQYAVMADGADPSSSLANVGDAAGFQSYFDTQFENRGLEDQISPLVGRRENYEDAVESNDFLESVDSLVHLMESGEEVHSEGKAGEYASQIMSQIENGAEYDFRLQDRRMEVTRAQEERHADTALWETEFSDLINNL